MLRISSSVLEQYRKTIETDYASADELASSIRGEFKPNWMMKAGSAWDAVLARPLTTPKPFEREGDYQFSIDAVRVGKKIVGTGIWQVKATRIIQVGSQQVTLVAKADLCHGLILKEVKAKFSPADPKDYEPDLQWRCYLHCFDAALVRYHLFSFSDPDHDGTLLLRDVISFSFWPYAGLENDVIEWLHGFIGWARSRRLLPFLEREGSTVTVEAA